MRKDMVFLNHLIVAVFLVVAMSFGAVVARGKGDFINVNSMLKAIQKTSIKSIQSSDGDIIDCVNIYKQPAFDHPALKNHTIQMIPSFIQEQDTINDNNKSSSAGTLQQTWQISGSCPEGTIPIRQVRKQDLLRFSNNLERFGKKGPSPMVSNSSHYAKIYPDRTLVVNNASVSLGPQPDLSSATLVATVVHYTGSQGRISVWNPKVERWDEYSTGQISLQSGHPGNLQSVEAGWIVNKKLYGDTRTRFFIYWTSDSSQNTGCFDVICSGFVQTNKHIALGGAFASISTPGGTPYTFTIQITQDTETRNWWLTLPNDKVTIGYWPAQLFTGILGQGATILQWGGEVHSANIRKTPHTTTAMGSGEFLSYNRRYSSYIDNIRVILGTGGQWFVPSRSYVGTYVDEKNCYAGALSDEFMTEPTFFFGGPGQNIQCP